VTAVTPAEQVEEFIGRMRVAGMPEFDQIEELMRTPPQAEVIEHVEQVVFSG
jgi:hypothetical protein